VAMMSRIILEAERSMLDSPLSRRRERRKLSISETICESVAHAAEDLHMAAIAVFTDSGHTARLISKYRPKSGVYAFCHRAYVSNRLNLLWGVRPLRQSEQCTAENMVSTAELELLRAGHVKVGDVIGIVAGTQLASGSTNFMRLHVVEPGAKDKTGVRKASKRKRR
jgi:pyruvate kinase